MAPKPSVFLRFSVVFAFILLSGLGASAQTLAPETRITQAVDNAQLTVLKGNVYTLARAEFDRGVAPSSLPMERMTLVLRPTPEQAAGLATLLDEQQDQSSPNYHKWLTPMQFGQQFGASEPDIQTITSWLQSQGFQVNHIANGRNVIEFSGTAGQVQQAFHTAIHKYSVPSEAGNEEHWANSTDPQIPTALAPVVAGIATLHNFLKSPQHIVSNQKFPFQHKPGRAPEFTGTSNGTPVHAVTPGDLAVIYNAAPLLTATPIVDGTGSTIAVVARSNVNPQDIQDFRDNFGVSGPAAQIVLNGADPGDLGGDEELEAVLDISYSGSLAQQANVNFVVTASTNTADGVDLSEMYIIDHNLGDVMTESFGGCEEGASSTEATAISNLAEQAAAQGITYLVSTGDSGSAGCDGVSSTVATHGVSVNILASTPYTVGVGGTMFSEGATPATYWSATNNGAFASAKSYIPEDVWNESCASGSSGCSKPNLAAGSGGVSTLFTKPSWQSGVAGIPSTGGRNLPDVSLTAAGHDPYLICIDGSCQQGEFEGVSGTSASVQAFGGIIGLVRQKIGARVGPADYVFYKLAANETLANCNGSKATPVPATNCIFYDTTVGNNAVPGVPSGDYDATTGYDRATGLGSVNVANLVNQWNTASFAPSVTTLTVNPTTFTHGASVNFNITVAPKTGTPSFTNEDVALLSSSGATMGEFLLSSTGTASGITNTIPGGNATVAAHYPGNGTLGSSDSAPVSVTVSAEPSVTTLSVLNGSGAAFTAGTFGTPLTLNASIAGRSGFGIPTGSVQFADNGTAIFPAFALNSTGQASTLKGAYFPLAGTHTVIASYTGDTSFLAGASSPITLTISADPTSTTVQSNVSQIAPGASITLTAIIQTTSQSETAASGSAVFFSGTTQIGNATVTQMLVGNAVATAAQLTTTSLATGADSITAKYSGDANFGASTSAAITVNVTLQPDFTVSAAPSTITVPSPGQSATATLTVTGANGFAGATTFSCSGLPSESTCAAPSVTGSGTTTLTVTTTAPSSVAPSGRNTFNNRTMMSGTLRALVFSIGLLILGIQLRRRRWNFVGGAVAVALLAGMAACGGGGGGVTPPANPGTPLGTQTVTVTATSGTLTHAIPITVTVN
jgi:Pro-kumamolisin, activation domain/Bacterial Ig-like domain (group 3)